MRTRLDDALTGSRREAAAGATVVAVGFALERVAPMWGQIAAGVAVWAFGLLVLERASGMRRRMLFTLLVWATVGELFCSLVWGVYTYRLGNIPHFLPPGHVLIFLIGMHIARRVTAVAADRLTAAYAVMTGCAALFLGDEFSVVLFAVYLLAYRLKPDLRPLLATMFLVTLMLELVGTTLGTWGWASRTPVLGLATTNPPFAVAAFYCVLDALVFLTIRSRIQRFVALRLSTR